MARLGVVPTVECLPVGVDQVDRCQVAVCDGVVPGLRSGAVVEAYGGGFGVDLSVCEADVPDRAKAVDLVSAA